MTVIMARVIQAYTNQNTHVATSLRPHTKYSTSVRQLLHSLDISLLMTGSEITTLLLNYSQASYIIALENISQTQQFWF